MPDVDLTGYAYVALFTILGVLFASLMLFLSWVFRPYNPTQEKRTSYECGVRPRGSPWVKFRIIYYLFALLFVIFDVEVIYLYSWGVALRSLKEQGFGWFALVDMFIFLAILFFGWVYAWRKGVLKWT